jgi:hypothetical protein
MSLHILLIMVIECKTHFPLEFFGAGTSGMLVMVKVKCKKCKHIGIVRIGSNKFEWKEEDKQD